MTTLSALFRLVLSGVLAYAGILKVLDPAAFHQAVLSYQAVDGPIAVGVTYWLPAFEIFIAIGLWIPRYEWVSAGASLVLMVFFTIMIAVAWVRGIDFDCGCFGVTEKGASSYGFLLLRDGLLIAVAAYVLWDRTRKQKTIDE